MGGAGEAIFQLSLVEIKKREERCVYLPKEFVF